MKHQELHQLNEQLTVATDTLNKAMDTLNVTEKAISTQICEIISTHLVENAVIICPRTRLEYYPETQLSFSCEIGFRVSEDENASLDFGSSFNIYYDDNRLSANVGTMGRYSKEDIYQIKRNAVIYNLMNVHCEEIEEHIAALDALQPLIECTNAYHQARREHQRIKGRIEVLQKELIEESLTPGMKLLYTEDTKRCAKIYDDYDYLVHEYTITKVTPKYVKFMVKNGNPHRYWDYEDTQCRKDTVIDLIYSGSVKICEDPIE